MPAAQRSNGIQKAEGVAVIHCPLYNYDFDAKTKENLAEVGIGCVLYEKKDRCKSRIGTGVCVAEEPGCDSGK